MIGDPLWVILRDRAPVTTSFVLCLKFLCVYHSLISTFEWNDMNTLRIGLVSISDRASGGVYQPKASLLLKSGWVALTTLFEIQTRLIPDEQPIIEQTLCELVDEMSCHLC